MKSPKPKDLTASLVHYKDKKKQAPRVMTAVVYKLERQLAFDPFTLGVWTVVGILLASQILLIVLPELA